MDKLFRVYDRVLFALSRAAAVAAGVCILAVAFIVCYEIVMRGLFGAPTAWVLEISTYLIVAAGFLGLGATLRHRAHIQVDFFIERLSPRARCVLELVTTALAAVLFFVFMTESVDFVAVSYEFHKLSPSLLRFPLWIPQTPLVAGSALLLLELVRQLWADARALSAGDFSAFEARPERRDG